MAEIEYSEDADRALTAIEDGGNRLFADRMQAALADLAADPLAPRVREVQLVDIDGNPLWMMVVRGREDDWAVLWYSLDAERVCVEWVGPDFL